MSSAALSLVQAVTARGGSITVDGEWLVIDPRTACEPIAEELHRHKVEIIALLESYDPLEDLRPPFVAWFDARIWLDDAC